MEDTRKRNEASMRRKQINAAAANTANPASDGPLSPASTGAMDVLLEKLRAAKPEAREQRDRRRRARLKDRHQVRVASGQKMPEIKGMGEYDPSSGDPDGLLSPISQTSSDQPLSPLPEGMMESDGARKNSIASTAGDEEQDVADRAASLLQGLRGDGDSLSVRRRRESADEERNRRRNRRRAAQSTASDTGSTGLPMSPPPIMEAKEEDDADDTSNQGQAADADAANGSRPLPEPPVVTVVSPPSPERTRDDA